MALDIGANIACLFWMIFIFSHVFGGPTLHSTLDLRPENYFAAESPVLTVHMM